MATKRHTAPRIYRVSVRLDKETRERLIRRARRARRTPTDYVYVLIERDLDRADRSSLEQ